MSRRMELGKGDVDGDSVTEGWLWPPGAVALGTWCSLRGFLQWG